MYIYKFQFCGYEGSFHFFMTHKNKYSSEELQKILDSVTSNYKLITALDLVEHERDSESFITLFDEFTDTSKWGDILTKQTLFENHNDHIGKILKEYHKFEPWGVEYETEAGYSDWEDDEK